MEDIICTYFTKVYDDTLPLHEQQLNAHNAIEELISIVSNDYIHLIDDFIEQRNKTKYIMETTQQQIIELFDELFIFTDYHVIPTSSFSSDMYISNEDSDIDFTIFVKNMSIFDVFVIDDLLKKNGFIFVEEKFIGKPEHYYIYTKKVNNIDIEIKIRDKDKSDYIYNVHRFLDNFYPIEKKKPLTYLKKIIKEKDINIYNMLKYLIYENALYLSGWNECLFGKYVLSNNFLI